ncbi:MAG TPA: hypothetical protein VMS00_15360 [Acidimicrobiales bacterium]|nr:hypothetical protein [Acidimicrobiales bacterium]
MPDSDLVTLDIGDEFRQLRFGVSFVPRKLRVASLVRPSLRPTKTAASSGRHHVARILPPHGRFLQVAQKVARDDGTQWR